MNAVAPKVPEVGRGSVFFFLVPNKVAGYSPLSVRVESNICRLNS